MSTPALDRDRLLADLRAAEADLDLHLWPRDQRGYWRCFGFLGALRVILAAIDDGDYDAEPKMLEGLTVRELTDRLRALQRMGGKDEQS